MDWWKRGTDSFSKYMNYWIDKAENTNQLVYFFRFEDVIKNPKDEITKVLQFVLGMEDVEGTVLEKRIEETLKGDPSKNKTYTSKKSTGVANMAQYTQEMLDYSAKVNEEVFHIFGYAKDDREDNTTPWVDYKGKAKPENVAKTNYYKELNKKAWEKRKLLPHGQLPKEKVQHHKDMPGTMSIITEFNIMHNYGVVEHLDFSGV